MNLLAIDPGTMTGWAVHNDVTGYHSGVWKFPLKKPRNADSRTLYNGERFFSCQAAIRRMIRKHEIEGVCFEYNPMPGRSDANAMLMGGWRAMIELAIFIEAGASGREIFGPFMFATAQWRSVYWGKYPAAPDGYDEDQRREYHKQKALDACRREGWNVDSDDEAEALLMLIAFRKLNEPTFAFERGGESKSHQTEMGI